MNPFDAFHEAHTRFMEAIDGIPQVDAEAPHHVVGKWNLRDLVAHVTVYEHLTEDAISKQLATNASTPFLWGFMHTTRQEFNDYHYRERQFVVYPEILSELNSSHNHIMSNMRWLFTGDMLKRTGNMDWFRKGVSVSDFLLEMAEHKKAHAGQVQKYKLDLKNLKNQPTKRAN
jgi:hypothetical protein